MTIDKHDLDDMLAAASLDIRRETAPPEVVEEAAARVWARLEDELRAQAAAAPAEPIRGCADVQALLPAFVAGALPAARALLVEDHTRECVPCRRALQAVRAGQPLPARAAAVSAAFPERTASRAGRLPRWALAAAATLTLAAGAVFLLREPLFGPRAPLARVEAVEGALLAVEGAEAAPLVAGAAIAEGRSLRSAKGSRSLLRLADGSSIEMDERAEIALADRVGGTTIELARGDIIVHAAPQRRRHLFVSTGDCLVSVTGTIFTVSRGTKGSRVGVIEGEVRVARGRQTDVLRPGEQVATHASLSPVPLAQEIAWSRDADTYLALLRELTDLGRALEEEVSWPGLRTSTRLLDLAPADTAVYAALPNVSESLAEAHALLLERVAESPALGAWWRDNMQSSGADERLAQVIERLHGFGSHLGPELVIAVPLLSAAAPDGDPLRPPVALAEVARPASFADVLAAEVARLAQEHGGDAQLEIVADPAAATAAAGERLYLWLDGDLFAASPSLELLREVQARRRGAASAFAGSALRARLGEAYAAGAGWLLGVDLEGFTAHALAAESDPEERVQLERIGLLDARLLVMEHKESGELTENRAVVSFAGPRRGVASWLAAPAPMGSLEFVSPEANLLAAFVVKTPTAILDDLFALAQTGDPDFAAHLAEFQAREGIDVRADLAAPLGGEVAFAVDGPMLPVPSWKLIVEVYDPARLQATVERLAARLNEEAAAAGKGGLELDSEEAGGRTFHVATFAATGLSVHYVYVDGYLVAGPSRALLERAIQYHETGYTLAGGEAFTALLPADGESNFSALVYQDLGPALQPVLGLLGGSQGLTPEQQRTVEQLAAEAPATLAYAYGEEDRIVAATRGSGPFGFNLGTLLGIGGVLGARPDAAPAPSAAAPATAAAPAIAPGASS